MFSIDAIIDFIQRLILAAPAFISGIVIHEYAHAWTAWKLGDPTAVIEGRLTLDPRAHFDPLGALMFVIAMFAGFGFGWAKPVPVNWSQLPHPLRDMALVAAAGPTSNVLLAFTWYMVLWALVLFTRLISPAVEMIPIAGAGFLFLMGTLQKIAFFGIVINFILAIFNLLPIPPLDGGHIAIALLPSHIRYQLVRIEPFGFLIILALLYIGAFGIIFRPIDILIRIMLIPMGIY